jgi:hypothetical protein
MAYRFSLPHPLIFSEGGLFITTFLALSFLAIPSSF